MNYRDRFLADWLAVGRGGLQHDEPINEEQATEAHRKVYTERSTSGMSASSMGTAAAMEVHPIHDHPHSSVH